jgi:hypothetical protein
MRLNSLSLAMLLVLGGCATATRTLEPNDLSRSSLGLPHTYSYSASAASPSAPYFLEQYQNAGSQRREVRNRIVMELMGLIDDEYGKFERQLSADTRGKNFGVSSGSIALTGVASFSAGATAKVLAAIDTALKGVSGAVDKDLLAGRASEALIYQMRANRSKVQGEIYVRMNGDDLAYPLEAAIRDLINYFNEGSVSVALSSLTQSAATQAASAASSAGVARAAAEAAMPAALR